MPDITLVRQKLPSTNNAWGFGGAYKKVAFAPEGVDPLLDNGWVFGVACYRHLPEHGFLRNNDLNIDRHMGSAKSAEKFIEKYYEKLGKTVAFK